MTANKSVAPPGWQYIRIPANLAFGVNDTVEGWNSTAFARHSPVAMGDEYPSTHALWPTASRLAMARQLT
jgi:hypothetical protein